MKDSTSTGGISFLGLLTIVFITLKLIGAISWNWFWVLSPILIPVIIVFIIVGIYIVAAIISGLKSGDDDES